jgi:hypothetical protein
MFLARQQPRQLRIACPGVPTGADTSAVVGGLFSGGGVGQLVAQPIGSGATVLVTFAVSFIIITVIERLTDLRLSAEGETAGYDEMCCAPGTGVAAWITISPYAPLCVQHLSTC